MERKGATHAVLKPVETDKLVPVRETQPSADLETQVYEPIGRAVFRPHGTGLHCPADRGRFSDGPGVGLYGLGRQSCPGAGKKVRTCQKRRRGLGALPGLCRSYDDRQVKRAGRPATSTRQAFCRSALARPAVQFVRAVVPADAAMVAQRHDGGEGGSRHHEYMVSFVARQIVDSWSPSNLLAMNPQLLQATREEGGRNLVRGWQHLLEDPQCRLVERRPKQSERTARQAGRRDGRLGGVPQPPDRTDPYAGDENRAARTDPDRAGLDHEVLHLDPTPKSSLIAHLVSQGYTVFAISGAIPRRTTGT